MITSDLSTRRRVMREANRRGLMAGILVYSPTRKLERAVFLVQADLSADGEGIQHECAVPGYWRKVFVRVFVKAAVRASSTSKKITVSSRGTPPKIKLR
jgi:hypothetical protein